MDIQSKLQELKELHDKGLITTAVYEEQQKTLLSGKGVSEPSPPAPTASADSIFLDPKANFSVLGKLAVVGVAVLIAIWLVYTFSGQKSKDTINELASQTGIGKQVIPWPDRADTAARRLIDLNQPKIAAAIQGISHPTGNSPTMNYGVAKLPDRIIVKMTVEWKGGFLGGKYSTTVNWEIAESNHIGAKIVADSAPTGTSPRDNERLDEYFRTKVYPAFFSDVGR